MIVGGYTSPSDQAMGSIDIAMQFAATYSEPELAQIGEATRMVMENALEKPQSHPEEWFLGVREYMGSPVSVPLSRLEKKARHAQMLLAYELLVSDEDLARMVIDNDFIRPTRQTN